MQARSKLVTARNDDVDLTQRRKGQLDSAPSVPGEECVVGWSKAFAPLVKYNGNGGLFVDAPEVQVSVPSHSIPRRWESI